MANDNELLNLLYDILLCPTHNPSSGEHAARNAALGIDELTRRHLELCDLDKTAAAAVQGICEDFAQEVQKAFTASTRWLTVVPESFREYAYDRLIVTFRSGAMALEEMKEKIAKKA
jgi:alpha-galactosidase/6-phospho-beta-glucosidase family protein